MSELPPPPPPPPAGSAVSVVPSPPRLAAPWTGVLLAVGGVLAIVSGFVQYEKLTYPVGSYAFTGLGSETVTGPIPASQFTPGNPGRTIFILGIIALLLGLLVVARQGRLWVGIVAVIAGVVGTLLGILALVEPSRDANSFASQVRQVGGSAAVRITGSVGIGAVLGTVGSVLALLAGIAALVARRSVAAPDVTPAPTGQAPGDELAS